MEAIKRHVANTAGMEQRSKFQNELTKKKRVGNYPKQRNQRLGNVGGLLQLLIQEKWLLSMIPLITSPGCRWTTWYHITNFLIARTSKYMRNWGKNILHLPKDTINWSMNSITKKVVVRFKTRLTIQGCQDSSISAALSERRSRFAKIEPSIVTKVVSFIFFQDKKFCCEHVSLMLLFVNCRYCKTVNKSNVLFSGPKRESNIPPCLSGPSSMKGISNHKQDWFAECCLTRLYTVNPELG
jgi:hypothetical protein